MVARLNLDRASKLGRLVYARARAVTDGRSDYTKIDRWKAAKHSELLGTWRLRWEDCPETAPIERR